MEEVDIERYDCCFTDDDLLEVHQDYNSPLVWFNLQVGDKFTSVLISPVDVRKLRKQLKRILIDG